MKIKSETFEWIAFEPGDKIVVARYFNVYISFRDRAHTVVKFEDPDIELGQSHGMVYIEGHIGGLDASDFRLYDPEKDVVIL